MSFPRRLPWLLSGALLGFAACWLTTCTSESDRIQNTIAINWGDGRYGPAFYGAHVYVEPVGDAYSVQARVLISRGNYYHDMGELGRVVRLEEAVARWGRLEWTEDGLHVGSGADRVFLPRQQLENHR
jgi:hypothetical protein